MREQQFTQTVQEMAEKEDLWPFQDHQWLEHARQTLHTRILLDMAERVLRTAAGPDAPTPLTQILQEVAERAVPANLDLWPAVRARLLMARTRDEQPDEDEKLRSISGIMSAIRLPWSQWTWGRRLVTATIVLGLMLALAATAVAVYNKIVVVEPSQELPGLEEAIDRAEFPLWISDVGDLRKVSEIGEGRHYTVYLDYWLDDGRRFHISESFAPNHVDLWDMPNPRDEWKEYLQLIERNVDINGYEGVFHPSQVTYPGGETEWGPLNLHWHAGPTSLNLSPSHGSTFTRDELITIARSLQRVEEPHDP